mmetsp:Transcript_39462/g.77660  ORF Transcript_39462/g.77660 Transcript_39462/m.77660 type:complete len:91 (+) Transcript_39462:43-315(+)
MKYTGVSGTDLKTYMSNFISKMLFIPDMSMSDKVYQYEKGLPEDVQKEVKRKKGAGRDKERTEQRAERTALFTSMHIFFRFSLPFFLLQV